ncbi:MAG: hypothetical protein K0S68_325 [Candidatus Saccharibacteria bacterium]|nr:hypothetical protein [Candidatus Saccharibacteria bacterium]
MTERNPYEDRKRAFHARSREFSTDMSEFARLFQRVVLNGTDEDRAQLKLIMNQANTDIVKLLDEMERRGS